MPKDESEGETLRVERGHWLSRNDTVEEASGRGVHAVSPCNRPSAFDSKTKHLSAGGLKRRERRARMPSNERISRLHPAATAPSRLRLGATLWAFVASGQVLLADPGTSFTYQARLRDSARPAGGTYDMAFALFDAVTNGSQISSTVTNLGVSVSNALFTVTLDFGTNAFDGSPRWLEISIRYQTNDFSVLAPRQPITATPYAIAAMSLVAPLQPALLPANVPKLDAAQTFTSSNLFAGPAVFTNAANFFSGAFSGDGSSLSNITSTTVRRAIAFPAPLAGTNYVLDFASDVVHVNATNNINFLQSINRPLDGYYTECVWYIQAGPTNCLLSFNPTWIPLGTLATNWPCILMSNKTAVVAFSARGSSESNVVYAVARQE